MEKKRIKNIEQQYTIIHDGYTHASESCSTLKEAQKRQEALLNMKYASPCRIIKETIVRQEVHGTYLKPIKNR